ncbi:hypothetical protein COY05_03905 [Candidatus Peregrinibacteria bacterium CG_4_10_14_0_2_um_filter_38_24]|nr:MAG: hypothetical protein COY05_03905 [Candidatus Peregrinibacteria bacterium CG_4_10_14_0_2_um_filter_38_24]PJC39269.1 MAG: hypothetical protein CO044_00675 [Candidatus Peregrinibacteria bacterium CG_4_9_14_0_2_um_filter_38_9]
MTGIDGKSQEDEKKTGIAKKEMGDNPDVIDPGSDCGEAVVDGINGGFVGDGVVEIGAKVRNMIKPRRPSNLFDLDEWVGAEKCLRKFFEEEAVTVEAGLAEIKRMFSREEIARRGLSSRELSDEDFDVRKFIEGIPPEALFSTSVVEGEGVIWKEEMMTKIANDVSKTWKQKGYAFLKTKAFRSGEKGFRLRTALKCPRSLGENQDLTKLNVFEEEQKDPLQALRYRILFALASHEAFKNDDGHRTAYMAGCLSVRIGKKVGYRFLIPVSQECRTFDVPSGALFSKSRGGDQMDARVFIKVMLSLLLPDKAQEGAELFDEKGDLHDVVQEEFVLIDLMGLAEKMEIYEEFEEVFAAIFKLRHRNFTNRFHLSSSFGTNKGRRRMSLLDLINIKKEYSRKPVKVFSLGHGDGFLEKELLKLREEGEDGEALVSEVTGVDLHSGDDLEAVETDSFGGNGKLVKVARGENKDKDRIQRVFDQLEGQADIGVAADSLHETENPFAYMMKMYDKIKPGGFLYVTDPIHCEATDKMTRVDLNSFDNTRHPSSMLSLEQYFEIIGYLTMKGAKIYDISITPGTYAGYNDTFWRVILSIRKPDLEATDLVKRDSAPYRLPIENIDWNGDVDSNEDIFKIWPFSCVREEDREKVLSKMGGNFGVDKTGEGGNKKKITFGKAKFEAIRLLAGGDEGRANALVHEKSPYGSVLEKLFAHLRGGDENDKFIDRALENFNHFAGEVFAIISLLKTECGIDISQKICEVPGWEDAEV